MNPILQGLLLIAIAVFVAYGWVCAVEWWADMRERWRRFRTELAAVHGTQYVSPDRPVRRPSPALLAQVLTAFSAAGPILVVLSAARGQWIPAVLCAVATMDAWLRLGRVRRTTGSGLSYLGA